MKNTTNFYPGNLICVDCCVNCKVIKTIDVDERKYMTICRIGKSPVNTKEKDQEGYDMYDCDFVEDEKGFDD